jgi:hypothetical protein
MKFVSMIAVFLAKAKCLPFYFTKIRSSAKLEHSHLNTVECHKWTTTLHQTMSFQET